MIIYSVRYNIRYMKLFQLERSDRCLSEQRGNPYAEDTKVEGFIDILDEDTRIAE
jgi:hypothetical protein